MKLCTGERKSEQSAGSLGYNIQRQWVCSFGTFFCLFCFLQTSKTYSFGHLSLKNGRFQRLRNLPPQKLEGFADLAEIPVSTICAMFVCCVTLFTGTHQNPYSLGFTVSKASMSANFRSLKVSKSQKNTVYIFLFSFISVNTLGVHTKLIPNQSPSLENMPSKWIDRANCNFIYKIRIASIFSLPLFLREGGQSLFQNACIFSAIIQKKSINCKEKDSGMGLMHCPLFKFLD